MPPSPDDWKHNYGEIEEWSILPLPFRRSSRRVRRIHAIAGEALNGANSRITQDCVLSSGNMIGPQNRSRVHS
jgi:hypothetical protein